MMKKVAKGFTLIELMIVVAIIGILAAIAVPNFVKFQCRSKQSEAKTNLKSIYVAQESFRAEKDGYGAFGDIGWEAKGDPQRYNYAPGAALGDTTFTATADGNIDAVAGDAWTIDQENIMLNSTNSCQ